MIYAFFLFVFVQKSFLTKKFILYVEINLTTRGPLYTCLVSWGIFSSTHFITFACKYTKFPSGIQLNCQMYGRPEEKTRIYCRKCLSKIVRFWIFMSNPKFMIINIAPNLTQVGGVVQNFTTFCIFSFTHRKYSWRASKICDF